MVMHRQPLDHLDPYPCLPGLELEAAVSPSLSSSSAVAYGLMAATLNTLKSVHILGS